MLKFQEFIINEPVEPQLLAEVFPKNRVTLLHGRQGSGKTYSSICAFNAIGIKPLYIDLDDTTGISELDFYRLSQELLYKMFNNEDINIPKDSVLIIDIYTRLMTWFEEQGWSDAEITKRLELLTSRYNITVIIIGHTQSYVTTDGLFHDNVTLARGCAEELFLEKKLIKGKAKTKTTPAIPHKLEYNLYVNKGRGSGGARIISNWMR